MKLFKNWKRIYYGYKLEQAHAMKKATCAGELSGFDNVCEQWEYDRYCETFDKYKSDSINHWEKKLENLNK